MGLSLCWWKLLVNVTYSANCASPLRPLHDHAAGLASADADGSHSAALLMLFQCVQKSHQNPRTACANRMAKCHCPSVDVDFFSIKSEDLVNGKRDNCQGLT